MNKWKNLRKLVQKKKIRKISQLVFAQLTVGCFSTLIFFCHTMAKTNTQAVCHHVLAQIDPNKLVNWGKPLASLWLALFASLWLVVVSPANRASQRLATAFSPNLPTCWGLFG